MILERVALDDPRAQALIARLNGELRARYPEPGANHFGLDAGEVAPGNGAFVLAVEDGVALACGAVRRIQPEVAELKRMFTVPEARGRGLARRLLAELETVAREIGVREVWLETGTRQEEAIRLYQGAGYRAVAPWGAYAASQFSVCLGKVIDP